MAKALDWVAPGARQTLAALTEQRRASLDWKPFAEIKRLLATMPHRKPAVCDFSGAEVIIGERIPADDPLWQRVHAAARAIIPWKKGPFRLFGVDIDAEWRSDFKWDRFAAHLPALKDTKVLDVGGNNGYYAFRVLAGEPEYVLTIDPIPRLWYQFQLLQHFAARPNLEFQMWGWQEAGFFKNVFDLIFNMGIIYHHTDPVQILRHMYGALKPGGTLVLESIIIPGDEAHCLIPPDRYARMRNVWFIPTLKAMHHLLVRTKFKNIRTIAVNKHEQAEQRTTPWNPGPSYAEFTDPGDPDKTIEGLPAPYRAILMAEK